jgi:hypothetical protein
VAVFLDQQDIGVFIGLDAGKSGHHAVALDKAGGKPFDKALPNDDETRRREILAGLSGQRARDPPLRDIDPRRTHQTREEENSNAFCSSRVRCPAAPAVAAYGDRTRSVGKSHNQALIALAHRRSDVLFAMLREGTLYQDEEPRNLPQPLDENHRGTPRTTGFPFTKAT